MTAYLKTDGAGKQCDIGEIKIKVLRAALADYSTCLETVCIRSQYQH